MNRIPVRLVVVLLALSTSACSYSRTRTRCDPCPPQCRPQCAAQRGMPGPVMGPEQPHQAAGPEPDVTPEEAVAPTPAPAPQTTPVLSGRFTLAAAGLQVRTPRGWKFEQNPKTVVYQASARVPSIVFFRSWGDSRAAAIERLPRQMSAEMRSVRVNRQRTPATVAGYPALMLEGTGRIEIFPVRWRAYIIEARQRVVMVAVAPVFFWNAQQARIRSFISSVRASAR